MGNNIPKIMKGILGWNIEIYLEEFNDRSAGIVTGRKSFGK